MAISLGSIVIELLANTAGFTSGMNKASYEGRKATKEIHSSFSEMGDKIGNASGALASSLGQVGAVVSELGSTISEAFKGIGDSSNGIATAVTALGALGAAAVAAGAGFIELGKQGAEIVEHLSQISQKTGIGVRDLQIFEAAGKTVGLSLDDMVIGLRKFDQAISGFGKGAAAQGILRELGVTAKDNREALLQTADAFAKMPDGVKKATDAAALFGKSGLNLIPILNKGRDGILEWENSVDAFGPKIGSQAVAANEKYRASVEKLSLQWDAFKVNVEQDVLPTLSKIADHLNGDKIRAFLKEGPIGYADAVAKLQVANAGITEENKKQSEQSTEQRKKEDEFQASLQRTFEIQKSGGIAAFNLEQARRQITDDVQAGLFKQASAIQSQLPALEKAAALEAQRAAEAKRLAASYESVLASLGKPIKPLLKTPTADPTKGIESLFGSQPGKNILDSAPDLGQPAFITNAQSLSDLLKDKLNIGKQALDGFYTAWDKQAKGTADSINETYDSQWAHFDGLFALGEITEAQFKDVSLKIEQERQDGLKRLRQDNGTSTFKDAWSDMFKQIESSGKDFARSISSDVGDAIQGLTGQLTQLIVTGKGLNFKQIGQSLETNLVSSVLKKGESSLFGSLGNVFGLGGNTNNDGSSANRALYVQFAGASPFGASGLDNLPLGSGIGNLFGGASAGSSGSGSGLFSGVGSLLGSAASGIGGFFSSIGSFFGGFLAEGGSTQPGRAYIVGEKRPELFVPRSAGTVIPSVPSGGSTNNTTVIQNISTPDADSFKRSSGQISSMMGVAASRGSQRNGR